MRHARIQRNPEELATMKAVRQEKCNASHATISGAAPEPTKLHALKMPPARPRSRTGKRCATSFRPPV